MSKRESRKKSRFERVNRSSLGGIVRLREESRPIEAPPSKHRRARGVSDVGGDGPFTLRVALLSLRHSNIRPASVRRRRSKELVHSRWC